MKRKKLFIFSLVLSLSVGSLAIPSSILTPEISAFGKQTLEVGARGKDVEELQGRLKFLGYYTGPIDGVFGWRTYWASRNFQYEFGMPIDGVVGAKTKLKLWQSTKAWAPSGNTAPGGKAGQAKGVQLQGGGEGGGTVGGTASPGPAAKSPRKGIPNNFSKNDLTIMANAVYGEARGEPYVGQVAVAAVILNRVRNASFPNTPSGVIFEPRAFTAVADGQIWLTPNESAKKAVQDAMNGWDPTGGAIYYFNPDTATSAWIWTRPQIKTIGKHIFCR